MHTLEPETQEGCGPTKPMAMPWSRRAWLRGGARKSTGKL
jgi:hypothetical protein